MTATINAVNERIGIEEQREHRSFKEQGIDREPTIHLGAAHVLERKGIPTERGDINREIEIFPNEHFIDQQNASDEKRITDTNFAVYGAVRKTYHWE